MHEEEYDGDNVDIVEEMKKRDDEHRRDALSTGHRRKPATGGPEGAFERLTAAFSESTDRTVAQSEKELAMHKEAYEKQLALQKEIHDERLALDRERLMQMEHAGRADSQYKSDWLEFQRDAERRSHELKRDRLQADRESKAGNRDILMNVTEVLNLLGGGRAGGL